MTNSALKKKIANSPNVDWLRNIKETFNFSSIDKVLHFKGVSSIYEFVNQQMKGWAKYENLPDEFVKSKNYFENIRDKIIDFTNNYSHQQNIIDYYWNDIKRYISNTQYSPVPYDIAEVEFLLQINKENPEYFQGAYDCLIKNRITTNNKQNFFGGLLAYEFKFKDKSDIIQRRNLEKNSIEKLKTDFQNYLNESEELLSEHLKNSNYKFVEYSNKIDDLRTEKESDFTNWFEDTKTEKWEKWYEPTLKKITDLENAYSEKLKLEEPAKFWKDRSDKLKKQGWISLAVLLGLVLISTLSLGKILWEAPQQIYESWFGKDKSAAIRWTIVYVTLISFMAFCVRAVSKVMFSSFHLARDCEERHALTYFYLSLLKDSKVDESDRQLIMQSLFSRAETGLLKDDSSPTMPSDTINKIISK